MADRKNFKLFRFRDVSQTGFPYDFVQSDRDVLREYAGGVPANDDASEVGVSNRSLATRIAEYDMVINTDPTHLLSLSGGRASSVVRKSMIVIVAFYDINGVPMISDRYLVQFHAWGSPIEQNDFSLLPIANPFYTDEPA